MRTTTTLATVAALLALTACSSTDDKPATADSTVSSPAAVEPTTTPTPAEAGALEQAVREYTAAYFQGDAETAYAVLSKHCQGTITAAAYGAVVEQAKADYGQQTVKTVTVDKLSGDLARVSYTVSLPKFDQQGQAWTREGGAWKYDAC
ncbi:hypothetical protein ACW4TU_30280 [Streptomyces sp. QTS52]